MGVTYKLTQSASDALESARWGTPQRLCRALLLTALGRDPVDGILIKRVAQRANTTRLWFTVTGRAEAKGFLAKVFKYRGVWRVMVSRVLPFHVCGGGIASSCHVCIMAGLD